jgi:Tol biopolymer transport system component/tRNA A-37 threonylcarbamoyl transferase component Bud32
VVDEDDDEDLAALASAVLDGGAPEWSATESGEDTYRQAVIRQLQVLSEIVAVHRRPDAVPLQTATAAPPRGTLGTWGPLHLLERIGQGAFGDVYRAWDSGLDREVALKLLRPGAVHRADRDTAIVEEGRLLAQVHHPNVLTVYGAERYDGRLGIWTEFIRGETLEARLRARGALPEDEVTSIGLDVCRALAAVHDVGTLHRDIKAANVMRHETGRIVLMDFGTGRAAADARVDLSGTPLYLAPEIFSGAPPTEASDTYAVAVLLFHLLSGAYPVSGRTLDEVRHGHAQVESHKLAKVTSGCSGRLARVITRGLAREPSRRYQSAHDFERALVGARARRRVLAILAGVGAVTATAVIWAWGARSSHAVVTSGNEANAASVQPVLLCADCGDEASMTEDGHFLVRPDDDSGDLIIRDLRAATDRRLGVKSGSWANSQAVALQPVWSPDGAQVAYRWSEDTRFTRPTLRVVRLNQAGPAARSLLDHPGAVDVTVHDWSRDGRRVLASERGPDGSTTLEWVDVDTGEVATIGQPHPAGIGRRARVSPDGRFIAYAAPQPATRGEAPRSGIEIDVRAADGSSEAAVVPTAVTNSGPVWSADGSRLFYTSNISGSYDLWAVSLRDGKAVDTAQLLRHDVGVNAPLGVAAGDRYTYDGIVPGSNRVVIVPVGGSFPQTPAERALGTFSGYRPRWSPDGAAVAFFRVRPSGDTADLVIRSIASGSERIVMNTSASAVLPMFWFKNGTLLEQVKHGDGHPRLFRVDVLSGSATPLGVEFPAGLTRTSEAALSADRTTLYAAAHDGMRQTFDRIVGVDLESGAVRTVVQLPGDEGGFPGGGGVGLSASPNGRMIAIATIARRRTRLAIVGVDGRGYREIYGPFPSDSPFGQVGWASDSSAVFVGQVTPYSGAGANWRVWRVSLAGGAPQPATPVINGPGVAATFDVSPDGRLFAIYPNSGATQSFDPVAGRHENVWQLFVGPAGVSARRRGQ